MTSIATKQLSKLIGLIHDAALTPALWPDALDGIRRALAGSAALLLTPLHGPEAGGLATPRPIIGLIYGRKLANLANYSPPARW